MARTLNRKIGIYVSRKRQLKFAEIGSPQADDILAEEDRYQLCAHIGTEAAAWSIFNSALCQHPADGVYMISFGDLTWPVPTSKEIQAIAMLIEGEYQRLLHSGS